MGNEEFPTLPPGDWIFSGGWVAFLIPNSRFWDYSSGSEVNR